MSEQKTSKTRWLGILIAVGLPSLVTWCYFVLLAGRDPRLQQGTYAIGKVVQFGFPIFWVLCLLKRPLYASGIASLPPEPDGRRWSVKFSLVIASAVGLAVFAAVFGVYHWGFSEGVQDKLSAHVAERVQGFSIDSWLSFVGLSVFYALVHSLLEEYYFRWFVFGQLRHVTSFGVASILSGLAFMAHHVMVLAHYFGGLTPITVGLSICIAMGGIIWAWQYEKSRSLLGPWLSHLLVDAGIFALGFLLLRNAQAI